MVCVCVCTCTQSKSISYCTLHVSACVFYSIISYTYCMCSKCAQVVTIRIDDWCLKQCQFVRARVCVCARALEFVCVGHVDGGVNSASSVPQGEMTPGYAHAGGGGGGIGRHA